jgi:hypothetical protein
MEYKTPIRMNSRLMMTQVEKDALIQVLETIFPDCQIKMDNEDVEFKVEKPGHVFQQSIPILEVMFFIIPRELKMYSIILNPLYPESVLSEIIDKYSSLVEKVKRKDSL